MNTSILRKVQKVNMDKKIPEIQVGDTVVVDTIIRDGDKQRIQKFKGIVLAKHGSGNDKTITVRKISYGVGVEKILPLYSTNISDIQVLKHAKVRRAKLFYMRGRIGKAAMKLKPGSLITPEEGLAEEVVVPEVEPETPQDLNTSNEEVDQNSQVEE